MTAQLPRRAVDHLRKVAFGLVAAGVLALGASGMAEAQSDGACPTEGILSTVNIRVTSPAPGSVVTGPTVTVRGTATALIAEVSRVEVTFGDETVARNYSTSGSIDFDITVDASDVPTGPTVVRVQACGSGARGNQQFSVAYQPRASATSTTVNQPTTTGAISPGGSTPAPSTTLAAGVAGALTPGGPTSTTPGRTTLASQPTTTVGAPAAPPAASKRPEPVRPGTNTDGSIVLSDSPDEGSSRPPLWVGAVVGVSGGVGLLFSATTWRRRHQPQPLEPVDPELVEVG